MDLMRALTYVFEDRDWMSKLAMIAILSFAAGLLMVFLGLGLVVVCVLLGYTVQLAQNVRERQPEPLPRWDNYGDYLSSGVGVLLALFVYHIPVMLMSCCIWLAPGAVGRDFFGNIVTLSTLCCVLPVLIIYTSVVWLLLAAAIGPYARTRRISAFFEVGELFRVVSEQGGHSIQYVLCVLILNLAMSVIAFIPCIGWLAALALPITAHGHLLGQYARLIDARRSGRRPAAAR